ncbi:MAG: hypothetical protein IK020_00595 [Clostridiales bacterium]|nr:hypothetical protein [Clostridiales bacterium]
MAHADLRSHEKADRIILIGLMLLAVGLTFVICPFSPLYRYCFEPDEISYFVVSRGFLSRKIPYRDLFDHKGPLTYVVYALGLLLSGGSNWGIWLVFTGINIGIFTLLYRNLRLFFAPDRSFSAIAVLLCFFFVKRAILYSSGSKPEHIILLLLLLSEYVYSRRVKQYADQAEEDPALFTGTDMYLLGLCAGGVFMTKMNICIYYLCFVGAYYLWLLSRKAWRAFLRSFRIFLSGIVTVSAPFFLYFLLHGALREFWESYFVFNTYYAANGSVTLHFYRTWISKHNQILITVSFAMMCAAAIIALIAGKRRRQQCIFYTLGAIVYFFITLPIIFSYTFCVLIPLYLPAFGILAELVLRSLPYRTLPVAAAAMLVVVSSIFSYTQIKASPTHFHEAKALESSMMDYYREHPDAQTLFFYTLCQPFFYDRSSADPDFRYFYRPRNATEEMRSAQYDYVQQGLADVVVFHRSKGIGDEYMEDVKLFMLESGYALYYEDYPQSRTYVFTRDIKNEQDHPSTPNETAVPA